ncbi:DUF974-domain-containing protein [Pholiota conissans]|uniref:DUF974-domain-containing protein n=1 Tax=Pholiota conissans TaxID=109636 RepID=A0A9P5YW65_9AGAR|nr:DUF974-domain-containing protein [Pholiota conissans]
MASPNGPAHLLSLKVMRVSRPELASAWQPFYSSSPSFSVHSSASILSLQGSTPLPGHPKTLRDLTCTSELLTLPSSFGSIQLGETFSSCFCINNETEVGIEVTQAKVEMQTVTTKVVLFEMEGASSILSGGDTIECVIHHEIKELGQHVLACTVTYRLPPNSRSVPVPGASENVTDLGLQTFRKFYKFVVANPLSVKTKVHSLRSPSAILCATEREKIFLEVHIQNVTQDAIYFERMRLECTDDWEAVDGNSIYAEDEKETSIFSGSMGLIQPQDIRQYVYILIPKNLELTPPVYPSGSTIPLGRLDISWRSCFGEPALPPHLKRTTSTSSPSRPHSPSVSQSNRSGTPPLVPRPGSPATNRASISSTIQPQSAQTQPVARITSIVDLDVQLLVRHIPRNSITVEKEFSIAFTIIMTSGIVSGTKECVRRKVILAIQHLRPRKVLPPVISTLVAPEAISPRVPSSGFSTPLSTTTTFNYALAHQKILAASSQPSMQESVLSHEIDTADGHAIVLPPCFEGVDELKSSTSSAVSFIGPSVVFLPVIEMNFANTQNNGEGSHQVQVAQEFELPFVASRTGFSTIGGIRILLVNDHLLQSVEEEDEDSKPKPKCATILKEYDVIGEVWVPR